MVLHLDFFIALLAIFEVHLHALVVVLEALNFFFDQAFAVGGQLELSL